MVSSKQQNNRKGEAAHGISCPKCAGMVPIPDGRSIVACPFCDQRSLVRGDRGVRRYQVPLKIDTGQPVRVMEGFFSSNWAIAQNALKQARLEEDFVVYLPFWTNWTRVLGWVFGEKKVSSGKRQSFVPREVKIMEDMIWTGAACDVGEFGVKSLALVDQQMEPFDAERLHQIGMVFEPIGSQSEALDAATRFFEERVQAMGELEKVSQIFVRRVRSRFGLVYYPLWVLRYLYRGRSFQIVVDGYTRKVLYGKAPGNTFYRAIVMVGGAAIGAFLAVDLSAVAFYAGAQTDGDVASAFMLGGVFLVSTGIAVITQAFRRFRYGEVYEYSAHQKKTRKNRLRKEGQVMRAEEVRK